VVAAVEELVAAGLHLSLRYRIHAGHADAGEHGLDGGVGEDLLDEGGEFPIAVSDQVARPAVGVLQIHHEILDRLDDPAGGWVGGGAQDADAPGGVLDDGKDVVALPAEGDGLDEVAGQ
jgi:hypothetical protein